MLEEGVLCMFGLYMFVLLPARGSAPGRGGTPAA